MNVPNESIVQFRRRGLEAQVEETLPAVFILGDDMHVAARVVASLQPVSMLQLRGGTKQTRVAEVSATVEHAIAVRGARTVVVCGQGSHAPERSGGATLLEECQWLRDHLWLARIFRESNVTVEAMWFDIVEGDIYWWSPSTKRFELMADTGLARLVDIFSQRLSRLASDG